MKKYLLYLGLGLLILLGSADSSLAAKIDVYIPAEIEQDQVFPAQVYLNTEQRSTVGTDLLFSFDPEQLEFVEVASTDFYPHYHQVRIDKQKGQLRYSGTNDYQKYSSGSDVFANLFFVKKDQARLSLDLVWSQQRTDDTNVVGVEGNDLIKQRPNMIPVDAEDFPDPSVFDSLSDEEILAGDQSGAVLGETEETITPRGRFEFELWWLIVGLVVLLFILFLIIIRRKKSKQDE